MAYEALYRRYRPSLFGDVAGQTHVVSALRNAVEADRVGHAYLFSGPRGTGKTSSARILAKALNCTDLQGGEPCDVCESCQAFLAGGSYDLHELDAASNNGVDAMRDLIGKVALGSPGRTKVYILDEAHMLTGGAENALLKTLEEPPPHVVFVLCTTEPNKVVPTIRSRTQHLEFSLLSAAEIGELVNHVVTDAGLDVSDQDRAYAIRVGGGSARDTLSALDQVVAAGGAPQGGEHLDAIFQALIDRDAGQALFGIDGALQAGRDAAAVTTSLLADLRSVFLAAMQADIGHLPEGERDKAAHRAASMPPARITRAIEVLGTCAIEMRQAPDPRVDLEVAVVRLTRPDLDITPEALLERIEALEFDRNDPVGRAKSAALEQNLATPEFSPTDAPEVAPDTPEVTPDTSEVTPEASLSAPSAPEPHQPPPTATAGKRGADLARAALAEQKRVPATTAFVPPSDGPATVLEAVAAARPDTSAAPKLSRTLADVRRDRQDAAAEQTVQASDAPEVPTEQLSPEPASIAPEVPTEQASPEPGIAAEPASIAPEVPTEQLSPEPGIAAETASIAPEVPTEQASPEPGIAADEVATEPEGEPAEQTSTEPAPAAKTEPTADAVAADLALGAIEQLWNGELLESMSGRARSRFSAGRFLQTDDGEVVFGLPNPVHRDRCEEVREEFDQTLARHFALPAPIKLVVDTAEIEPDIFDSPRAGTEPDVRPIEDDEEVDLDDLVDAKDQIPSAVDQVLATFEGSVVVDQHPSSPGGDDR